VNREQPAHVLRAAARITGDSDIVVLGSQSILGTYGESELPVEALLSMDADLAFRSAPDEQKSDEVDGSIGESSPFHEMNAYYAQGVSITTATLPTGWELRLVGYHPADAEPSRAMRLERHDLVIAKLVAGREKDFDFTTALLRARLVDADTLVRRAGELEQPGAVINRVRSSIARCVKAADTS